MQQLLWTPQTPLGPLTSRTWFEQRFTRARCRLSLSAAIPIDLSARLHTGFHAGRRWEEYFVNINSTGTFQAGFDQNRVFVGVGYNVDDNIRTEIGYMNQYINRMRPMILSRTSSR